MSRPIIRVHNSETNEVIDREMTVEEFNTWQETVNQLNSSKKEEELKNNARANILKQLGITEEQAKILLS
jgi:hypothetical protein